MNWRAVFVPGAIVVAIAVAIYFLFKSEVQIGSIEIARGLIALLFGFGLFFVAIYALYILSNTAVTDEAVARFNSAKEIFTALIAVFGTILGFYFGTNQPVGGSSGSSVEAGLLVGLSGLGINVTDIPDEQVARVGEAFFSTLPTPQKTARIREILETEAIEPEDAAEPGDTGDTAEPVETDDAAEPEGTGAPAQPSAPAR